MIDYQLQQAQFRTGIQEGEDPRALKLGTLLRAENFAWRKGGRLDRRRGLIYTQYITPSGQIFDLGNGKIACSIGKNVLDSEGNTIAGYFPNIDVKKVSESRPTRGTYGARVAVGSSTSCVVWAQGDPLSSNGAGGGTGNTFAKISWSSGRESPAVIIGAGIPLEVFEDGADYVIVVQRTTPNNITLYRISKATNLVTVAPVLITGATGYAAARKIGSQVFCLYSNGTNVNIANFDFNGTALGILTTIRSTNTGPTQHCIGYDERYSADLVYFGWIYQNAAFEARSYSVSGNTLGTVRVVQAAIATTEKITQIAISVMPSGGMAACDTFGSTAISTPTPTGGLITVPIDNDCLPDNTRKHITFGVEMVSEPIYFGSDAYIAAADNRFWNNAPRTTSTYLLRIPSEATTLTAAVSADYTAYPYAMIPGHPHDYAAKIAHVDGACSGFGTLARAVPLDGYTSRFIFPFMIEATGVAGAAAILTGYRVVDIVEPIFWFRPPRPFVNVGGDVVIGAGVLSSCDGANVFDYGFAASPAMACVPVTTGGAVATGTYINASSYEFLSRNLKYRSDLSNVVTVTTTSATSSIRGATMRMGPSNKQPANGVGYGEAAFPQISVKRYRSTIGGSTLFKLTLEPGFNMLIGAVCQSADVLPDVRADNSVDGAGSVVLATRPEAYTNGGVLGDIQPPYFSCFVAAMGRLWGSQPSGREVWFSKRFDDDFTVAPGFVTAFRLQFDFVISGLGTLDNRLVIFGESAIAVVEGNGPTITSGNNDYAPQRLQTDVGCIDANSIVTTPDGIMFRSRRGIMLLDRGLSLTRIGRPIQDIADAYPIHMSSALVSKDSEVRFSMVNRDYTAGIVAVYDYEEKEWSTFTYPFMIKQIVAIGSDVYMLDKDGYVYVESDTTGLDNNVWSSQVLDTAWISANGPIAFQSVRRFALMGECFSNHHLKVEIFHDYETDPARTIDVDASQVLTSVRSLNDLQLHVGKRAKCNAVRFRITVDPPDAGEMGNAKGVSFSALAVEVGIKRGLRGRTKEIKR
jgi:hypothetical protein